MVLTGPIDDQDSTVLDHLDKIYSAFRFYNGSFERLQKECSSRRELIQELLRIGKELEPLYVNQYHRNLMKSFNPLPYFLIPNTTNRYFIKATQLLTWVEQDPDNLAGCLLWTDRNQPNPSISVLCSHLEPDTTRWIYNRLHYLILSGTSDYSSFNTRKKEKVEPISDFMMVYMNDEEIKKLSKIKQDPPKLENDGPVSEAILLDAPEGTAKMGLYILSLYNLSIAIIMNLSALYDPKHMKKMRLSIDAKLQSLEDQINEKVNPGQIINNVNINPVHCSYNFFSYDHLTQISRGTQLIPGFDISFAGGISNAHHIFHENPGISQVLLRDHCGGIYCRKIFGKEYYFQQWNNNISHDRFMELIEKTVRSSLKSDHNINLL